MDFIVKLPHIILIVICAAFYGCTELPLPSSTTNSPATSDRMFAYVRSTKCASATTLLMSPNDPMPTDKSLIEENKRAYQQRGFDAKRAEQCARDDFTAETGRSPNSGY